MLAIWCCERFDRVLPYTLGDSRLGRLAVKDGCTICDQCEQFEGE